MYLPERDWEFIVISVCDTCHSPGYNVLKIRQGWATCSQDRLTMCKDAERALVPGCMARPYHGWQPAGSGLLAAIVKSSPRARLTLKQSRNWLSLAEIASMWRRLLFIKTRIFKHP